MSLTLRAALGYTEAVLEESSGLKRFYEIAEILSKKLKISFFEKEDDFDSIDWRFSFNGYYLTLHYNIYTGISLFPSKAEDAQKGDNETVIKLAGKLEPFISESGEYRKTA